MHARIAWLGLVALLAGCTSAGMSPSSGDLPRASHPEAGASAPRALIEQVSCGGPAFPLRLLDEPGRAETFADPAAQALRRHLAEPGADFEWLPDAGWREVVRTETEVVYIGVAAPGTDPPYAEVSVSRDGDGWRVTGWGQCRLRADAGAGLGPASFRVAPGNDLTPEMTEIPVLITELACNTGQDARGRIGEPRIMLSVDAITVVFSVRPRAGGQDCQSNPETPHLLVLPEPLGDRALLDGSEIPAGDATVCGEPHDC